MEEDDWRALRWSTFAGLATAVGGLLAIIRRPVVGGALLAFLLGCAIGVMATLSVLELVLMNAFEHGVWEVSLSTAAGVAFYCLLEPMLPHMELPVKDTQPGESPAPEAAPGAPRSPAHASPSEDKGVAGLLQERARLLRLGMLMALTMTLHNLPEGFAVAFASFTSFGPVMALAVAIHNVPEGLIVAAPIFAATGQRWRAFSVALLSGLSEPLGALVALKFVKPFLTPLRLQYMLAGVGGIMTAVCYLELWCVARVASLRVAHFRGGHPGRRGSGASKTLHLQKDAC